MRKTKYVIIQFKANDPFEFPTRIFNNTTEMATYLGIARGGVNSMLRYHKYHLKKTSGYKYERVWLNKKEF